MFGKGICEKIPVERRKMLRDEKFPEPKGEENLVSRLVFFAKNNATTISQQFISAYHQSSCEFEPRSWRGVLDTK
jgi:hypothetical protein